MHSQRDVGNEKSEMLDVDFGSWWGRLRNGTRMVQTKLMVAV
ncbi:MAG TPA: hypothetical protein VFM80_02865 [Gracilimonas sp.]|nr:hypothetical protein [Gracilimonas sp.]